MMIHKIALLLCDYACISLATIVATACRCHFSSLLRVACLPIRARACVCAEKAVSNSAIDKCIFILKIFTYSM